MKVRIEKWGDRLAICIPANLATEASLAIDSEMEMAVVDGKIVLEPEVRRSLSLAELVSGITDENRHDAVDWGPAVGKEVW